MHTRSTIPAGARFVVRGLVGFLSLTLCGCASLPAGPIIAAIKPPDRLQVLELPSSVPPDSLTRLYHSDVKDVPASVIAQDQIDIEQKIDTALKQAFAKASLMQLQSASMVQTQNPAFGHIDKPLSAASLAALQARHPASDYLRIRVTDYGQTPRSWKTAYVTFEVVTTLAIAGALYVNKVSRPLAGVYLVQESVEEFGEGYAGFWLINRMSRPVRIEADLVSGKTGKVLWHESETGMADWHWTNLWHMDDARRDTLLQHSTDHAIDNLVKELEKQQ